MLLISFDFTVVNITSKEQTVCECTNEEIEKSLLDKAVFANVIDLVCELENLFTVFGFADIIIEVSKRCLMINRFRNRRIPVAVFCGVSGIPRPRDSAERLFEVVGDDRLPPRLCLRAGRCHRRDDEDSPVRHHVRAYACAGGGSRGDGFRRQGR